VATLLDKSYEATKKMLLRMHTDALLERVQRGTSVYYMVAKEEGQVP
jgi:hypothetical protein